MKHQHLRPADFRAHRSWWPLLCGVLLAAAAAQPAVAGVFPDGEAPYTVVSDDFEGPYNVDHALSPWMNWKNVSASSVSGSVTTLANAGCDADVKGGVWGAKCMRIWGAMGSWYNYVVAKSTVPGHADFDASVDLSNLQIEYDFDRNQVQKEGAIWAAQDADANGRPETGYVFRIGGRTPGASSYNNNPSSEARVTSGTDCSEWGLYKINGEGSYLEIGKGDINSNCNDPANPSVTYTVSDATDVATKYLLYGNPYRVRLTWYCGNLRVQIVRIYDPDVGSPDVAPVFRGCGAACVGGSTDPEDCWCTLLEWTPLPLEQPLAPGGVGVYGANMWNMAAGNEPFDNIKIRYYDADCGLVCDPWMSTWQQQQTDAIPFKFLYEGALLDYSAGRKLTPDADRFKIDINTEAPASASSYNHSADANPYCNGWRLLADLPGPTDATGNIDDIQAFLEPMYTAVDYESDGAGNFSWVGAFDNDPLMPDGVTPNPDYDPVPMIADGSTPINSSLLEAFDWYVAQRTTGAWASDPYEGCRQWYVILITDGEEACEPGNPDAVCDPGGAAEKFADPGVEGVDPLPVYTIGFSESVAADSPLKCIAEDTGGLFLTAENASQLSEALYDVFYRLEGEARSFTPYKIAPPPSGAGGNATRDYLVVYPFFQPQESQTLWSGNLWAFPLNKDQPDIPTVGDCEIDTSQMVWNAYDALEEQIDDYSDADPTRFVYMGSDATGSWVRHEMGTMKLNPTLRTEFINLLDVTGGVTDPVAQQVVNFVRNIYQDDDLDPSTPGPPALPRPSGYPVLGDTFHSQPVIVNPPNTSMYFFNYGYTATNERGAHDYGTFVDQQAKRRRLVLAGANDGMLHAYDAGVWDRNRGDIDETYDKIHDLGNGTELFAWVPQAVMNRLYSITSGGSLTHTEPLDMVDGPIVKGDAFIDFDGDSSREWRTVALANMRKGGRGIVALDITQADPTSGSPDYEPVVSRFPGCREGSTPNCSGEFPRLMWEFSDTNDMDSNGEHDLGWTWSKPAIARIAISQGTGNPPDDIFVAFFGGGWDEDNADQTGTYFYGVDLETGAVLVKHPIAVDLPGGVTALDSNVDGFHDRIYFADSDGSLWRIQYPDPTHADSTGAEAGLPADNLPGVFTRIYDFRAFSDRQEIFTRPVPVPTLFDGSNYTWALAFGSGDRAELDREDSGFDHFFFVLDVGDSVTRTAANLLAVDYSDLDGGFECTTDALDPPTKYGWYLSLRETEKVVFDASVLNGYVFFPTFDPSTETATYKVPSQCGGAEEGGTPVELSVVCRASGIGRTYKLWYECGLGDYREYNDIVTGMEVNNSSGSPKLDIGGSGGGGGGPPPPIDQYDPEFDRTHSVTNWRQE